MRPKSSPVWNSFICLYADNIKLGIEGKCIISCFRIFPIQIYSSTTDISMFFIQSIYFFVVDVQKSEWRQWAWANSSITLLLSKTFRNLKRQIASFETRHGIIVSLEELTTQADHSCHRISQDLAGKHGKYLEHGSSIPAVHHSPGIWLQHW